MANQTFKNEGGKTRIYLAGDSEPAAVVGAGESVTTDNEELKTALRKAGFSKGSASKEKK